MNDGKEREKKLEKKRQSGLGYGVEHNSLKKNTRREEEEETQRETNWDCKGEWKEEGEWGIKARRDRVKQRETDGGGVEGGRGGGGDGAVLITA